MFEPNGFITLGELIFAAAFSILVAALGRRHALTGPASAQVRSLLSFIATSDDPHERQQAHLQIEAIRRQLREAIEPSIWGRGTLIQAGLLFVLFIACAWQARSPAQALVFCILISLLWAIVSTDLHSCDVLDVDVFAVALFCALVTTAVPAAGWTNPQASLIGFTAMGMLIGAVALYFRCKRAILRQPDQVVFGDGDTLLLLALSLYFGVDVIAILGFASLLFTLHQGLSFVFGKSRNGAPFVPAIFAGVILTILLSRPAWLDLNRAAIHFLHGIQ
jgi:prepilin signal peptidase PulO-like enzyme (type II secretory pathway)